MTKEEIIQKTIAYVKETLTNAEGGHDWWHIFRVWTNAKRIAEEELKTNPELDTFIIELGALLHDIADSKFHGGDESVGPRVARDFLQNLQTKEPDSPVTPELINHIENIIKYISFKGCLDADSTKPFTSSELQVIQDADRLDAMGAIGIARCFNYGGHKGRALYDPTQPPRLQMTKEEYKSEPGPSLNHFYEKLLLLKDRMNTKSGKMLAKKRHKFMRSYLEEFYAEWGES